MRSYQTERAFMPRSFVSHLYADVLLPHPHHRAAQDRVSVGEQLHPEDVPLPVCQSQQFNVLHRLFLREVSVTACSAE